MKYLLADIKSWARENLKGYVPVVFTPYSDDDRIDEKALRADIDYTLSLPSVGGVYVGSIYQEFWTLTQREREILAEIVIDQTAGRVPVIISASHTSSTSAIELAQHAHRNGADLVMLWPPYFGPRDDEAVIEYYRAVLREVPIGFAFYNSGLSEVGFQMSSDALRTLAAEAQMCALKEASLRLETYIQTMQAVGRDVLVSSPLEEFWLIGRMLFPDIAPQVLLGSSRALFLQTRSQPHLHQFYVDAVNNDFQSCRERLLWILNASENLHTAALRGGSHPVGLIKELRRGFGQSGGRSRPPVPTPDPAHVRDALTALRNIGLDIPSDP